MNRKEYDDLLKREIEQSSLTKGGDALPHTDELHKITQFARCG